MENTYGRYRWGAVLVGAAMMVSGCGALQSQPDRQKAKYHLEQAETYEEQGLLDSALAAFGLAIEENPKLTEAHLGMGDIYRERGDYQLASNAYERAAQIDPQSFDAHYFWGLSQQLLGKLEEAVRLYLRALTINPNSAEANEHLASAYLQQGKAAEALPYARRATQLAPSSQTAWANLATAHSLLEQFGEAVDAYRQAVELGDNQEPILLGLANAHLRLEHYDRAAAVLETLIRQKPSATAYERLGYAQFKLRRYDNSLASFRAALSLDATDTSALNGLGVCLMTLYIQGDRTVTALRDEALAAWRKSLELRPNQARIIDLLARYQRL